MGIRGRETPPCSNIPKRDLGTYVKHLDVDRKPQLGLDAKMMKDMATATRVKLAYEYEQRCIRTVEHRINDVANSRGDYSTIVDCPHIVHTTEYYLLDVIDVVCKHFESKGFVINGRIEDHNGYYKYLQFDISWDI